MAKNTNKNFIEFNTAMEITPGSLAKIKLIATDNNGIKSEYIFHTILNLSTSEASSHPVYEFQIPSTQNIVFKNSDDTYKAFSFVILKVVARVAISTENWNWKHVPALGSSRYVLTMADADVSYSAFSDYTGKVLVSFIDQDNGYTEIEVTGIIIAPYTNAYTREITLPLSVNQSHNPDGAISLSIVDTAAIIEDSEAEENNSEKDINLLAITER